MKKLSTIIMAMALVLGMSQCKKQETPATPNDNDGMVYITVNVDNDGGRHHIDPSLGIYAFTNGDKLYVGNGDHYVGTLTYTNGAFTGNIEFVQEGDILHFYFVGGKNPDLEPGESLMAGYTPSFTVTIADQSNNLPILSYGCSDQPFSNDPDVRYSTTLRNKCALVKIGFVGGTTEAVKVSGMLTKATIDFASQGITPVTDPNTIGDITLYSENVFAKWAVLLPQEDPIEAFNVYIGDAQEPSYTIPGPYTISNNDYINDIKIQDVAYPFGKVIGEDGSFYSSIEDALNNYTYPVAVVVYVGNDYKLAIELGDTGNEEGPVALNWGSAMGVPGSLNDFIGSPIPGGTWRLPTVEDWEKMSSGNYGNSVYDFTGLLSALNNAGAAHMNVSYWTGTDDGDNATCIDFINPNNNSLFATFNNIPKDNGRYVRSVLVF